MSNSKYNAEKLLLGSGNFNSETTPFLKKISPDKTKMRFLKTLRNSVREQIRTAWKNLGQIIQPDVWNSLTQTEQEALLKITPIFRSQGSYVYGTLNLPAHISAQELDIDDGMYLPMNIVESNPKLLHTTMFKIIDDVLSYIASENTGWTVNNTKATCGRLITDLGIHIDVNAYAIPDTQIASLKSQLEARNYAVKGGALVSDKEIIDNLESDCVNLAHRSKGWIISDPQTLKNWVNDTTNEYGNQFIHLSRIIKAWRDFIWEKGGPSSIGLMAAIYQVYCSTIVKKRLDEALLQIAKALPELISSEIMHPVLPNIVLSAPSEEDALRWSSEARIFSDMLEIAIFHASSREECNNKFVDCLGPRIPNNPDAIESAHFEARKNAFDGLPAIVTNPALSMRDNTQAG
jgi:hypothetical protein